MGKLRNTHLVVSFKDLKDDQVVLETALKNKVVPLSKSDTKSYFFKSEDIFTVAFLNDLISMGYNAQAVLKTALRFNINDFYTTTEGCSYTFESSEEDKHDRALYNFLDALLSLHINMTFHLS